MINLRTRRSLSVWCQFILVLPTSLAMAQVFLSRKAFERLILHLILIV